MNKSSLRKFGIAFLLVLLLSLFAGSAYAREDKATVQVFRIDKTFVIIKITFPTDISGSFAGEMAGKHFDCITIPPNVLICIGRFRVGPDPAFLTIYDQETDEIFFQHVIISPPTNGKGEPDEPAPAAPPSGDDDDDGCGSDCG